MSLLDRLLLPLAVRSRALNRLLYVAADVLEDLEESDVSLVLYSRISTQTLHN